jgi:capsular exopolysaccharide synthesis family protein
VLAAIVGLLIGLAAAFLIDYLDDKIRLEEDLEFATNRPVLSVVPVDPPPDNLPIALSEPTHDAVEAYRALRTNLQFLGLDRPIRVIQLTSSLAGEGKTTTSSNLAVVLAQAGHRVALVDGDLRRPRLHEVFGISQTPGFTDLLFGLDAKDIVHHVDVSAGNKLSVYPSGTVPSNPSEILSGRRISQLLMEMGAHYDYVIVDSAPILPVSDSVALAASVDGVLVVAHAGRVTQGNVKDTLERLDRVAAPVLGMVLNRASNVSKEYYAYGGYSARHAPTIPTGVRTTGDVATSDAHSVTSNA